MKIVFFDVDGTLLSHKLGAVPESTKRAIRKLRENGILTVIATGRHMIELSKLPVMELEFDGYLTLNGQLCLDKDHNVIAGTPIDPGEMEVLSSIFRRKRIPFLLTGETDRYINYVNDTVIDTQAQTHGTIPTVGRYQGEAIYQIVAFVHDRERELLDSILGECDITSWNATGIDIIAKGGGKAVGIEKYLSKLGIDKRDAMAFGDGENDIQMLCYVGTGVAMGNAADPVKAAADYVTADIDEDGIEKALIHFGLID